MGKSEWKEVILSDIIDIKHGWAFPGSGISSIPNKNILVTPGNFKIGGGFKESNSKFFIGEYPKEYLLNPGDLIVTMTDLSKQTDTLGYSGLVPRNNMHYLHNQRIGLVKIKSPIIHKMFLYWLMRTYNYQRFIANSASGTTVKHTSPTNIGKYTFFCPPLPTQQKIASILSSLDDKIELNQNINDNLEQQAQALFKSWFVDFEPFQDGEFIESELGMIPIGWRVGNIYENIEVIYGAPYKSNLFNDKKIGLPLIRIRDLKTFNPQYFTEEILPNTEYIQYGDVVAGMDAEFTPYIWYGKKGVLNQRVCKFVSKNTYVGNFYILNLMKPELEFVQNYKVGTTVSHLGKSDIDRFTITIPPQNILKKYSEITNALLNTTIKNSKEIIELIELRDTLLPRLMSGEISVEEIEI